jgi:hypothetical protein
MRPWQKSMAAITDSISTRVIDLAELGGDEFPAYMAVCGEPVDKAFILTPAAMRWSERTWLLRLEDCRHFWLAQKKKLRCRLRDLFDPLLREHFGKHYVAVLGSHPWPCLLYLDYQQRHRGQGIYRLQSRLDENIYRRLDWDSWFRPQQELAEHLTAIRAPGFRVGDFSARQGQLRRFIERTEVDTPGSMREAGSNSIRRRFGKWLGLIWRWSFTAADGLDFFPWRPYRPRPAPEVSRELEYPVNQWNYVVALLREDFERLCEKVNDDDCMHVNRMRWEILLFNEQRLELDLCFRNPYSLHRDRPDFATALYQARYLYDDEMSKLRARDHDLDLPVSMPLLRWRIELSERVALAPQLWDLFASAGDEIDYQRLQDLQNKLSQAFESYRPEASFLPEQSFSEAALGTTPGADADRLAWICGAINKPLFCYQPAQPIEIPEPAQKVFLERASAPWWMAEDTIESMRDYYIVRDRRGRASWAYRTRDGAWFRQGEFH